MTELMTVEKIAQVAYETNRTYCALQGDKSFGPWEDAPDWQKKTLLDGVMFHMKHPEAGPEVSHVNWLAHKLAEGWTYGPVKNPDLKQHPCCVPYSDLPPTQKAKDSLFIGVVRALIPLLSN